MILKRKITVSVLHGEEVKRKYFKELHRETTDELRTIKTKGGLDKVLGNIDKVEGVIYSNLSYKELVNKLIRKKYSVDEEFSIQRQRDTKPEEFKKYYDDVENIKAEVKDFISERESLFGQNS